MPLLIVPWTSPKHKKIIIDYFNAELFQSDFWASNFRSYSDVPLIANNVFKAKVEDKSLLIVTAGYGEQNMEYGIHLYLKKFEEEKDSRRIYFVGSCYALKYSKMNLGDILIPNASEGGGAISQYYRKEFRKKNRKKNPTKFDEKLVKKLREVAKKIEIKAFYGKVFCAPLDVGFEWKKLHEYGYKKGFAAGELESAVVAAISNYYSIPSAAILCVKDKGHPGEKGAFLEFERMNNYKVISREERMKILEKQLELVKLSF
jgi:purine-nucleoside phosphorylase